MIRFTFETQGKRTITVTGSRRILVFIGLILAAAVITLAVVLGPTVLSIF